MHRKDIFVTLLWVVVACSQGPTGSQGPPGTTGPTGPQGPPGPGTTPPRSFSVLDYGAKQDEPAFDNTGSFQSAIDAAVGAGGGTVWVPFGRFWFSGSLAIGGNVSLAGVGVGPYDPGADPSSVTAAPTLLPTGTAGTAFIDLQGYGALENILIHYPNQVRPDAPNVAATGPIVYPPTVLVSGTGKIFGCTFANSYVAIQVMAGRTYLENLQIGGYKNDIIIDHTMDFVHISHITTSVFWDTSLGLGFPQPIDTWVANNSVALTSYRMDSLSIEDFDLYWRNTGIAFYDSPQGYGATYGRGSDIDIDSVQYGVIAKSVTANVGFLFTNLVIGPQNGVGTNMIWLPAGGAQTPNIVVEGGSTRGSWAKPLKVEAGTLRVRDIVGLNPIGRLPALGLAPPALPPSGIPYASSMPAEAQVSISGGSVQGVLIGGQSTGLTSGMFKVAPGESIAVVYTSAPVWSWFLE
jgi:Pectate lyase superfamily protein